MGLWDRVKARLGLGDDYDDYDDEYYDPEEDDDPYQPRRPFPGLFHGDRSPVRRVDRQPDIERAREAVAQRSGSSHIRPVDSPQLKMHIVQPRSFSEAQTVADKFRADIPVIVNLTGTDAELSKRMIDFASGLTYGLEGGLQRISDKVFMLTPANYDVSAEDKRRLKDKGLFTLGG